MELWKPPNQLIFFHEIPYHINPIPGSPMAVATPIERPKGPLSGLVAGTDPRLGADQPHRVHRPRDDCGDAVFQGMEMRW